MMRRFGLLSAGLHVGVLIGLFVWFHHAPPMSGAPDQQGLVELVLVQNQGTGVTKAPPKPAPAPEVAAPPQTPQPEQPELPKPEVEAEESLPAPQPPAPAPPAPPTVQPTPAMATPPTPPVQQAQEAPEINLGGNDGETNAIAFGPHLIPASVDSKFHNKEPVYPAEAVRRGQQGAVVLVIHVAADGLAHSVDVERSSGYVVLDRAAQDAVSGWHFLPAVKDGQPVPFDMALRVVFHLD